jgi:hypothetical protein
VSGQIEPSLIRSDPTLMLLSIYSHSLVMAVWAHWQKVLKHSDSVPYDKKKKKKIKDSKTRPHCVKSR